MACLCASVAHAQIATYITSNANGLAASPAEIVFRAHPDAQIRVVSIQWQSDTNNAALEFQTAVGAYSVAVTNPTTTFTTQAVNTTSGLITNRLLVLQHLGATYKALLVATNNGTNVVLDTGGWGVLASVGDSIFPLSTTNRIPVGATTNWQNGEALYVGGKGRPVRIRLNPSLTTNALPAVTVRYE